MPTFASRSLILALSFAVPVALSAQTTKASNSPSAAVQDFMRALADSNLTRMGELFGTTKGPVSRTKPKNYEKQIVIMQLFLHGVQAQALGDVPGEKAGIRSVTTLLTHNGCKVTIPVNTVKAKEGWLVYNFDLVAAAKVNQPCDNSGRPGNDDE